jgi:glycosyltransferase involved in cell wall biosynthesis
MDAIPAVSVIIPTYNRAHLLAEAIHSVLGQTYADFEVLVVDDGSTDDTASVVASFADPRVRYLYQEHAERSTARNRGMAAAKGQYIALLDDDDLYLPHKLASEVAFLEAHPEVDLCGGGTQIMDASGAIRVVVRPWQTQPEPTLRNCLYGRCLFATCSMMFRRRVLDRLDHWFDPQLNITEDTDFVIRAALAGSRLAWLPEVVATYRFIHTERPLRILLDYNHAFWTLLDKLSARPDMPGEMLAEWPRVKLHYRYLFTARAYAYRQVRLAQRELLHALILEPALARELPAELLEALVKNAADDWVVADPQAYINYVFDHLPAPLARLKSARDAVWQAFCQRNARPPAMGVSAKAPIGEAEPDALSLGSDHRHAERAHRGRCGVGEGDKASEPVS